MILDNIIKNKQQPYSLSELVSYYGQKTPLHIALVFDNSPLTYQELDEYSSRLACFLQQKGVKRHQFVAIHLERSFELIIAIIAIQKAGGAYVPIDTAYPPARINFLLEDANASFIITNARFLARLPQETSKKAICLDQENWKNSPARYQAVSQPEDSAYMIYTSGSTGNPKGVPISHKNMCFQLEAQQSVAPAPIEGMLLTCSISFDVSALTIFWAFYQGAPLILPLPDEEKDIPQLTKTIRQHRVSHLLTLPTLHTLLLEQADPASLQSLRLVNVSGEICPASLVKRHQQLLPHCQLYNLYGPTEATVNCTYYKIPDNFAEPKVAIGIPLPNYKVYILNEQKQPVTGKETGEIYIGGSKDILSKGYWNRPELNKERFIKNHLSDSLGIDFLYKTGDLARWLPNGLIDFLGRKDNQIKWKGYRIELGEIETAIDRHPKIKETVVLLQNHKDWSQPKLTAYLTTHHDQPFTISELQQFLAAFLPNYMLPSHLVLLPKMPLTTNGKFNRKALPLPNTERPKLAAAYQPPQGKIEKYLAQKWEHILQMEGIGRKDKFFELGGSSIQAAQVIGQIQTDLNTSIFITTIFDHPTIEAFAKMLERQYAEPVNMFFHQKNQKTKNHPPKSLLNTDFSDFSSFVPQPPAVILPDIQPLTQRAIFILAPPRSGTSLLSLILGSHPKMQAFNELNLLQFADLKNWKAAFTGKFSFWQEGLLAAVMELKNCNLETARRWLDKIEPENPSIQTVFEQLQNWLSPKILVDKTPAYALYPKALERATRIFKNPFFIHLTRHPAASIRSFEKYHIGQALFLKKHPYPERQLAELVWVNSHQNIQHFFQKIPAHQQFQLSYEELVTNPESSIRKLCLKMQIPFSENMLKPYDNLDPKIISGIHAESRSMSDSHLMNFNKIDAQKAQDWKKDLSNFRATPVTQQLAKTLGYSLVKPKVPPDFDNQTRDIAIVGMAVKVAGASSLHEFWTNLVEGQDVSREVNGQALEEAGKSSHLLNDPNYVRRVYSPDDIDQFDADFFGILPKEAAMMDPQHRVFLQTAYHALESAGINPFEYDGKIGVFGGVARNAYFTENIATHPDLLTAADNYTNALAYEKTFAISRIAYHLNLRGPAVNVQTACSSSGTAVHLACQSLLAGDSDAVLVGGGRIQPHLLLGYQAFDGGPLSMDGYLRAFDNRATGMVKGNGMVCIVLKKLDQAIADRDHIWAVIKSTAINNDGSNKTGFTAPAPGGQAAAIEKALQNANLSASDMDYIEAHGTGTRIGDPIELAGLQQAFQKTTQKRQFCGIGSVKTNIGHLDAGACVAGIIKTALALKYELLPPSLHFQQPNDQINWQTSPFYVNAQLKRWQKGKRIRRAGVSSFGLGGTNAHVILEEAPATDENNASVPDFVLLPFSAKSEAVLEQQIQKTKKYLQRKPEENLLHVSYTLATGRADFPVKKALLLDTRNRQMVQTVKSPKTTPFSTIFLFAGGGAQYPQMGLHLYQTFPYFRRQVDFCIHFLLKKENIDLRPYFSEGDFDALKNTIRQPIHALASLFTIEYALAKLWQYWGIQPDRMLGHSMGEYTAACIAGVFSVEDGLRIAVKRGRLFESLKQQGSMLSVAMNETDLQTILPPGTAISVINKVDNCVVSGTRSGIARLQAKLEKNGIDYAPIHIEVAAHSPQVEPVMNDFSAFLKKIDFSEPTIPIISNFASNHPIHSSEYWVQHLRQPVRFADSLTNVLADPDLLLLEVGPGQTLATFTRQHPARKASHLILSSVRQAKEQENDVAFLLKTLGKLWCANLPVNWQHFYKNLQPYKVALPTYPFAGKRFWIDPVRLQNPTAAPTVQSPVKVSDRNTVRANNSNQQFASQEEIKKTRSAEAIDRVSHLQTIIKDLLHELSGIETDLLEEAASFLELGFDSLLLTQAVTKINRQFSTQLSFRQFFEEVASIEKLAKYLDEQLPSGQFEPPVPTSTPATSFHVAATTDLSPAAGNLQQIVQQQLQIMQQQIALLSQQSTAGAISTSVPAPKVEHNNLPTSMPLSKRTSEGEGFGPWKPVSRKNAEISDWQHQQLADFVKKYVQKTKGSQQISARQRPQLSDPRSIQAFNSLWKDAVYQIAINRSKGSKMWDVDGNEYIDFLMSFGIGLFGHTPDFVQEAVKQQVEKGIELAALPPLAHEVARLVCEITGMERTTLVNTGSEAISAAIRAARTVTGRDLVAVFEGDYHGITDEMLVRGVQVKGRTQARTIAPGIPNNAVEKVLVLYYDDPQLEQVLLAYTDQLAAIIVEPFHTQTPHLQRKNQLELLRAITTQNDIALVYDELVTGFRATQRGAQGWYGIEADICAYGKIASGGLPIAMVAGKARYLDAFDGGQWQYGDDSFPEAMVTFFGGTFVKHPLSLAAAKAALTKIKKEGPQLQLELNTRTRRFAGQLRQLFLKTKAPLAVKSAASVLAIKVIDDFPLSGLIFHAMRYRGVYMTERAGFLSVAHSAEDLEKVLVAFENAIAELFERQFFLPYDGPDQNEIVDPEIMGLAIDRTRPQQLPLTDGQEEIWTSHQFSPQAAAAYNLSTEIQLVGKLDFDALQRAIHQLVQRHEALRTTFSEDGNYQIIAPTGTPEIDYTDLLAPQNDWTIEQIRRDATAEAMNLATGPLVFFHIVRLKPELHSVLLTAHHIIADGWSLGNLTSDLGKLYALETGHSSSPLPKASQLGDFARQYQQQKQSDEYQKAAAYWQAQYKEEIPVLHFPTDHPRPPVKTYTCATEQLFLEQPTKENIVAFARKRGVTFYNLMLAAFHIFTSRISQQQTFPLGLVAAGQAMEGNKDLVAHSVSLLPLKLTSQPEQSFSEHLKTVRTAMLDAFEHQSYTLGALVKALQLPRDLSRQPIVSVLFNLDTDPEHLEFGNLAVSTRPVARHYETFDLFINVKNTNNGIRLDWIYNTDLFEQRNIQLRLKEFSFLLKNLIKESSTPVQKLPLLPTEEQQLLKKWNETTQYFQNNVRLEQLFAQQATKTPNRVALTFQYKKYTYQQIVDKSDQLAAYFQQNGVKTHAKVGIYLERSAELLISLLAVFKSGALYIPLDPVHPPKRLQMILEDAEAEFLVTHQPLKKRLPDFPKSKILSIENAKKIKTRHFRVPSDCSADDYAYIIYTSGSTGKPKGIAIPHRSVVDHHHAIIAHLGLTENEKVLALASVGFDPSVLDFFMPLMLGAQVHIVSQETARDGFLLKKLIQDQQPTFMQATPSTWKMLEIAHWQGVAELKAISGGEGLSADLAKKLLPKVKELWNFYGPTETTIWATIQQITEADAAIGNFGYLPVGKPIFNKKIYLLDEQLQLVPIGVSGEIYIAGNGVALEGYWKNPLLNHQHFIKNPFTDHPDYQRLYKTGDRGRWLPDGQLEYLNRGDKQVKIRGHRIELGEIEATLAQLPTVENNCVLVKKDPAGQNQLVAYLVVNQPPCDNGDCFKNALKSKLPEYMIPTAWVIQQIAFPINASGKTDRKRLPEPNWQPTANGHLVLPPKTDTEKMLWEIWKNLLGIQKISIYDDFFELGGHSLLAINMMAKIKEQIGRTIPLATLLSNGTIHQLGAILDKKQEGQFSQSLVPIKPTGSNPPLYLVHGGGLHVLMYQTLAKHMDEAQPIYALQAKGLDGKEPPLDRVEDMATHYLQEIFRKNPDGPYALGGYSFGGLIAFEMAKQLQEMSKEVLFLAAFDTVIRIRKTETWAEKMEEIGKKVSWNLKDMTTNPKKGWQYRKTALSRKFNQWKQKTFQKLYPTTDRNQLSQLELLVNKSNVEAWQNYRISPYNGDLFLFRVKEKRFYLEDPELLGWQPFIKGNIKVIEVDGDHQTLFNPPYGERFARKLQACLLELFRAVPKNSSSS